MRNVALKIILACGLIIGLFACQKEENSQIKIGIILPIEHRALHEIVNGFTAKLREIYPYSIQVKVMNAQGDINLQKAIIQQMYDQHYSILVPIATGPTQMTAAMVHDKPIISLAARFSQNDLQPKNLALVEDEIAPQKIIEFIHATYPKLTHLSLIHSASDKIYSDVEEVVKKGQALGMTVKPVMVATLPELSSATQSLPAQTQGILILKDNLIVSGIGTLAHVANEKQIPLVSLDQSSVEEGAGFSLGVHERQIGEEGAQLAYRVLKNKMPPAFPRIEIKNIYVFINKKALLLQGQDAKVVEAIARHLKYPVEFVKGA